MYSFYGGRPGNSFTIVKAYGSVDAMVADFQQGPAFTDVHYDEYVIINTTDRNDTENGRLYRRGYNFSNSLGGAQYIGTISGPAGAAPLVEMSTIENITTIAEADGHDERYASGSCNIEDDSLVPGKSGNSYNDEISWASYSLTDNNGVNTTVYLGFQFPYLVTEFETTSVTQYDEDGIYSSDTSDIERIDDGTHPFYQKWNISVPKGIKGDSGNNFRVITADNSISTGSNYSASALAQDIAGSRKVLVYDYYNYDNLQNPTQQTIYLGDYNIISNVELNEEGAITVNYTHNDSTILNQNIKWIDEITLSNNGTLTVIYNTKENNVNQTDVFEKVIKWIDSINLSNDGVLTVNYNNDSSADTFSGIQWISQITTDAYGTITVTYNTGNTEVFTNAFKKITNATISMDGALTFYYKPSASAEEEELFTTEDAFPIITDLKVNTLASGSSEEGSGSQKIAYEWNNSGNYIEVGNAINYIMQAALVAIESETEQDVIEYHFYVLYSDPEKRAESDITYNGKTGWIDLGSINFSAGLTGKVDMQNSLLRIDTEASSGTDDGDLYAIINDSSVNWTSSVIQATE